LLPVGCELDRHCFQYNLGEAAAGLRERFGMGAGGESPPRRRQDRRRYGTI
jgi:hypothetical protein